MTNQALRQSRHANRDIKTPKPLNARQTRIHLDTAKSFAAWCSITHTRCLPPKIVISHSFDVHSLHLTDNLLRPPQTLHHLLTLLPPADGILALLEQIVQFLRPVHLLQQFPLHLFFRMPVITPSVSEIPQMIPIQRLDAPHCVRFLPVSSLRIGSTYSTKFNIIAFGTISIIVRLTIL